MWAFTIPSTFPDLNTIVGDLIVNDVKGPFLNTLGIASVHRPYQPAKPLLHLPPPKKKKKDPLKEARKDPNIKTDAEIEAEQNPGKVVEKEPEVPEDEWDIPSPKMGLDLGVEATAIHMTDQFVGALGKVGVNTSDLSLRAIPVVKLHFHKGLGKAVDVSASGAFLSGVYILGGQLQYAFIRPARSGMFWALRLGYSVSSIDMTKLAFAKSFTSVNVNGVPITVNALNIKTKAFTPSLVFSRPMDFAEPYMGIGYSHTSGKFTMGYSATLLTQTLSQSYSASETGKNIFSFLGVAFDVFGLRVTMEGGYSFLGYHTMGIKAGLAL